MAKARQVDPLLSVLCCVLAHSKAKKFAVCYIRQGPNRWGPCGPQAVSRLPCAAHSKVLTMGPTSPRRLPHVTGDTCPGALPCAGVCRVYLLSLLCAWVSP